MNPELLKKANKLQRRIANIERAQERILQIPNTLSTMFCFMNDELTGSDVTISPETLNKIADLIKKEINDQFVKAVKEFEQL